MTLASPLPNSEPSSSAPTGRDEPPPEILHWTVAGQDIRLETDPAVFRPTVTTTLLVTEVLRAELAGRAALVGR